MIKFTVDNYYEHGEFIYDTPETQDGVDRWVCNYCGEDLPLDLNTDILPHLQDNHEDIDEEELKYREW